VLNVMEASTEQAHLAEKSSELPHHYYRQLFSFESHSLVRPTPGFPSYTSFSNQV
jgi:hypothetical protein